MASAVVFAAGIALLAIWNSGSSAQSSSFPPHVDPVTCGGSQLNYWAWDHYTQLWRHRCVDNNGEIKASEGDIVAFLKTADLETLSPAAYALIDFDASHVDVSAVTAPSGDAPTPSEVVWGRLKKSSACSGADANTGPIPISLNVGCDHDLTYPTDDDIKATDIGGSVGVHAVRAQTANGPVDFTLDISRWAKGDVFSGVYGGFMKVYDRDFNFKRYIGLSDHERFAIADSTTDPAWPTFRIPASNSIDPDGPGNRVIVNQDAQWFSTGDSWPIGSISAGCAVNYKTGELFVSNYDWYDPGINVIGRHPGDTSSTSGHGDLPYSDLSQRISTARFRQFDVKSRNAIDANPESVRFDHDLNLYVAHSGPYYTGDGSGIDITSPDIPSEDGAVAPAGHRVSDYISSIYDGDSLITLPNGNYLSLFDQHGGAATGRLDGSGNPYWEDQALAYERRNDANPFAWLLDNAGLQIPFRRMLGRGLHRYPYRSTGTRWSVSDPGAEFHVPFVSQSGVDWIELLAPQDDGTGHLRKPRLLYTSEYGDIHQYDSHTGAQLGNWNLKRLYSGKLMALRILPPGDGTDLIVAGVDFAHPENNALMRVQLQPDGQAQVVQTYTATPVEDPERPGTMVQPFWNAVDISPDGKTLWANSLSSPDLYQFDVATGAGARRNVASFLGYSYGAQGLCIMWQFNAQQELCGNNADDDDDGVVDNGCERVPTTPDTLVARNDSYVTRENVSLNVNGLGVLGNDGAEFNRTQLTAAVTSSPAHGALTLTPAGTIEYVPTAGFHGTDSFAYHATLGAVRSADATVTIVVTPVIRDDGPFSTPHTQTLTIAAPGVFLNDCVTQPCLPGNYSTLTVVSAGPTAAAVGAPGVPFLTAQGSQVTVQADGRFSYAGLNFSGTDVFYYTARDAVSDASNFVSGRSAKVTILVTNSLPIAVSNSYSTAFETPIDYRYAPCAGVQPIGGVNHIVPLQPSGSDCVPDDAANFLAGVRDKDEGGVDADVEHDPLVVQSWGLPVGSLPPAEPGESWLAPASGDPLQISMCAGLAQGTVDAYCRTSHGARLEIWTDGRFRYYPAAGFSGTDVVYYRVTDGVGASNWATITFTVNPRPTFPAPVAVGNAYETTTGFNLDVHYPPCFAVPGQIEGQNYFPPNLRADCPPAPATNPNKVNGLITLARQQTAYVDADQLDSRGVQILQFKANPAPPAAVSGHDADWADDLTALKVHSWGEKQGDMPGPLDLGTWQLPAVGDDVNVCRGMAHGTTDAYCPTKLGGSLELWDDGTFRYQPPNVAMPQPDWFWYRVSDGHNQLSNWAQVTINIRAKMLVRPADVQRAYGATTSNTNGVGYYDFLLNDAYTETPQSIARPANMTGTISCTAWADGTVQQPHGTVPVSVTTAVGRYPITCEGEDRAGYEVVYQVGELRITPVPLKVKADPKTKVYNGHPYTHEAPFTASYVGFVAGDGPGSLGGALAFGGAAVGAVNANIPSTPSYTIDLGGYTSINYDPITYEPGQLVIMRAPLTVRADDQIKDYDGQIFSSGYTSTYSGFVNNETPAVLSGSLTHTGAALAAINANTGAGYAIVPGGQTSTNYDINYVAGALRIRPVGATVVVPDKEFDYDGNPHATSCTVTGAEGAMLPGTLSYVPSVVKNAGVYAATCTFAGDENHTGPVTGSGAVTIRRIPLHIKAGSGSKTYGSPFSVTVESYSGFIAGENAGNALSTPASCDSVGSPAQAPVSGSPYSTNCSGAVSQNYIIDYTPGTLTLGRKSASVTPNAKSKIYGDNDPALDGSTSGFLPADNVVATYSRTAGQTVAGGPYTISAALAPSGVLDNYDISYATAPFTISKRPLTVVANNKSRLYGAANPGLDGTLTGVVGGDGITASYATTAVQGTPVGTRPITATLNDPNAKLSNYTVTSTDGTLTINPVTINVKANDQSKVYDGQPFPVLGHGVSFGSAYGTGNAAFVNGETSAVLGGILTYTGSALTGAAAGTYQVTPAGLSATNYLITYSAGNVTITKAVITIKADDKTRFFGAANPAFTSQLVGGLVGGETPAVISGAPVMSTTAVSSSPVGSYPISIAPGTLSAANYTFIVLPGVLTITPAPCTASTSIASNFNGTAIPGGRWIWFNSNFKVTGLGTTTARVFVRGSTITFTSNAVSYTLPVPDASITFSKVATTPSTLFNTATNEWQIVVPMALATKDTFLQGLAFPVPAGFQSGINPVTWNIGNITTDTPGVGGSWKWSAAVYTTFGNTYNLLGVKASEGANLQYNNSDHVGTPEAFKSSVTGGARGGGGSDWTGSWSGTKTFTTCTIDKGPILEADDDSFSTTSGTPLVVPASAGILLGDTGPTDLEIDAVKFTDPANGTVFLNDNGGFTYVPNLGFAGTDTFTYFDVAPGGLVSNVAVVTIVVNWAAGGGSFTTFTQGGWGATPSGNNPGALLATYFAQAFPGGVAIGSTKTLTFTSASAVAAFLPTGGPSGPLTASAVNPTAASGGTIVGQLLALRLSVEFSDDGLTKPGLSALKVKSGKLAGYTVKGVLALANGVVGGSTSLPTGVSLSDLNGVLDSINQNYDNGTKDAGFLIK